MKLHLKLPYPPTVNHYWKTTVVRRGRRYVPHVYIGEAGIEYRKQVMQALNGVPHIDGPAGAAIILSPPDERQRDLDNPLKCLLDSLTKANVWTDDSQLKYLVVIWGKKTKQGRVNVLVEKIDRGFVATAKTIIRWLLCYFRGE